MELNSGDIGKKVITSDGRGTLYSFHFANKNNKEDWCIVVFDQPSKMYCKSYNTQSIKLVKS
jgi:hypothetical protein